MTGKTLGQRFSKFRLHTVLLAPFILQIVAAVSIVGFLSFLTSRSSINDLADQLRNALVYRIEEKLNDYLNIPTLINQLNVQTVLNNELGMVSIDEMLRHFCVQLEIFPTVNSIAFGRADGNFISVDRLGNNQTFRAAIVDASTDGDMHIYSMDTEGDRRQLIQVIPDYDPRTRPWFKTKGWSRIYSYFSDPILTINFSQPLFDSEGNMLGVLTSNLSLAEIGVFLSKIEISESAQALIIERSGDIVTSSNSLDLSKSIDEEGHLASPGDSEDLLTSSIIRQLQQEFDGSIEIRNGYEMRVMAHGQSHFVKVSPLTSHPELDWLIVVSISDSDFMDRINANAKNTVLLCFLALSFAIFLGILSSKWMTSPINRLSEASNKLAQGSLDHYVEPSPIIEIDNLANSFNGMANQLKESLATLESKNEELRLAEENYRSIFENALEGIFQSSPDGRFIQVNPSMVKILGYNSQEELFTKIDDVARRLHINNSDQAFFIHSINNQDRVQNFEYITSQQDGTLIWVQEDTRAIRDKEGHILYFEGILQDITERKRIEEELKKQLEELKIEIDQQKLEREVAEVTESNYFRELKQQIENIDLDDFWERK